MEAAWTSETSASYNTTLSHNPEYRDVKMAGLRLEDRFQEVQDTK